MEVCEFVFYIDLFVWSLINWWYCDLEVGWFKSEILMYRIYKKKLIFYYINGCIYWNIYRFCKLIYKSFIDFIFIVFICRDLKSRYRDWKVGKVDFDNDFVNIKIWFYMIFLWYI